MGLTIVVLEGVGVLLAATLAFDVVHVTLHRLQDARRPRLRAIGAWHAVHHRFLGTDLVVDRRLIGANLRWHVVPEYATHVVVTTGLLVIVPAGPVLVALAIETLVVALILRDRGLDLNHRSRSRVPAYRPSVVCLPAYHALHHVWPSGFYGSWVKVVDMALGTAAALGGRSAALVGSPDDLGDAVRRRVASATGRTVAVVEPELEAVRTAAAVTDLLVLIPGPACSAETVAGWIEAAIEVSAARLVPIEVWALVPEGGRFAAEGRGYFDDARLIYRHVVLSRPGSDDPERVARAIVARVRRGAHRIHTGGVRQRVRDFALAWRFVRPRRRGPRAAAVS